MHTNTVFCTTGLGFGPDSAVAQLHAAHLIGVKWMMLNNRRACCVVMPEHLPLGLFLPESSWPTPDPLTSSSSNFAFLMQAPPPGSTPALPTSSISKGMLMQDPLGSTPSPPTSSISLALCLIPARDAAAEVAAGDTCLEAPAVVVAAARCLAVAVPGRPLKGTWVAVEAQGRIVTLFPGLQFKSGDLYAIS